MFALLLLQASAVLSVAEVTWVPGDPDEDRPYWMNREGGPAHPDRMASLLGPAQPPSTPIAMKNAGKIKEDGYEVDGKWVLNRYNPPFTISFLRTNEIQIPVKRKDVPVGAST